MNQINKSKIIGEISKAPKLGKNRLILLKKEVSSLKTKYNKVPGLTVI